MIHTKIMEINKDIAEEFLLKERKPEAGIKGTNRKSGPGVVREYADAMLRGEWQLTHQGLAFNENEELIDGGHRMRALVLADSEKPGITVRFMVSFDISSDAMVAMDIGKRRVPSDFLSMEGEINTTVLGGIIRLAYCYYNVPYVHTESWSRHRITPSMQKEFLEANPLLRDAIYETFPLKKILKASASGSFWFLARSERPDVDVTEFLDRVRSGEMLEGTDPRLKLRDVMLNARSELRRYTAPQELAFTIKAFNKWLRGTDCHQLTFRSNENFPSIDIA